MYYPIGIRYMPPLCLSGERKSGARGAIPLPGERAERAPGQDHHERHKEQEQSKSGRRKRRAVRPDGTQRTKGQNQVPRVAGHARAKHTTKSRREEAQEKKHNGTRAAAIGKDCV